jgi:hypothetical protein
VTDVRRPRRCSVRGRRVEAGDETDGVGHGSGRWSRLKAATTASKEPSVIGKAQASATTPGGRCPRRWASMAWAMRISVSIPTPRRAEYTLPGADDEEVIAAAMEHARDVHDQTLTRDQALSTAHPA